jgi:hypothetical protein
MAAAALSIKLRCGSWQQLATIYRRDLARGSMFLKATSQPPVGTIVRIDLELPSATVIELTGTIIKHVVDPARGTGVELQLEPLPTKSVWLIESALASDTQMRAQTAGAVREDASSPASGLTDGREVAEAETELVRALEAEVESMRKLNPFLVLGVDYDTTDANVRAAFGELTKRYHPDRFARYQSPKLRQVAAEIFILIRDAYRRLADAQGRAQVLAAVGPRIPTRPQTPPRGSAMSAVRITPPGQPPGPAAKVSAAAAPAVAAKNEHDTPTSKGAYDAPTNPSSKSAQLAGTELARADSLEIPLAGQDPRAVRSAPVRTPGSVSTSLPRPPTPLPHSDSDAAPLEAMIDEGRIEEALVGFRLLVKKYPQDRAYRAGIELCEGLEALAARDRLEAAQRFEAALELDPSNERAARELADMRRQATNERKGLLSRLMGKKEPLP